MGRWQTDVTNREREDMDEHGDELGREGDKGHGDRESETEVLAVHVLHVRCWPCLYRT